MYQERAVFFVTAMRTSNLTLRVPCPYYAAFIKTTALRTWSFTGVTTVGNGGGFLWEDISVRDS
jgi:hypothetical protein